MGIHNDVQSKSGKAIYHTYNETLEGSDAVKCLNQSKHTQSWCEKWVWIKPHMSLLMTEKQLVVIIIDNEFQYQPPV